MSAHLVLSHVPLVVPYLPGYSHLPVLCGCAQVPHGCRTHSLILEWPCPKGSRTGIRDVVVMENHDLLLLSRLQRHSGCLRGGTESDKIHAGGQTTQRAPKPQGDQKAEGTHQSHPIPGQWLEMAQTQRTPVLTPPGCSSPPGAFGSSESSSARVNLPGSKGSLRQRGIRARGWDGQCGCIPWDSTEVCPYAKHQEPARPHTPIWKP